MISSGFFIIGFLISLKLPKLQTAKIVGKGIIRKIIVKNKFLFSSLLIRHIGAAAGAARILGLNEEGIISAMGLAAEQAGLSRQPLAEKVNGKNILCGLAAAQGIHSAFAAQAGIKGAKDFITGRYGLNNLFASGNADVAGARLATDLHLEHRGSNAWHALVHNRGRHCICWHSAALSGHVDAR